MKHHDVAQGSPEWDELRLNYQTASEAPVVMASHKNMKRDELLEAKATQTPKEFSSFVIDVVFEKGHETEALARPIVEEMIGEELYPVTGSTGDYLASFDGMNMLDTISMEHKQWNTELAAMVRDKKLPDFVIWQLEHQFKACDTLEKIIFVVSDGTINNFEHLEYVSDPAYRSKLSNGWIQFAEDLAVFKPTEKKVEAVGIKPENLPALVVQIGGTLTTESNLEDFKRGAYALIEAIPDELVTDDDFADAAETVKFLDTWEKRIDLVKSQSLSKTMSLEELFNTMDDVKARMRKARLLLNKQVETQKKNRKNAIVQGGIDQVNAFIIKVNKEFKERDLQVLGIATDMYGAIKGMSNFSNMQSTINDEVARFKINANESAAEIRTGLAVIDDLGSEYMFLFQDLQELVSIAPKYLKLEIESRISKYKEEAQAAEQKKIAVQKEIVKTIKEAAETVLECNDLNKLYEGKAIVERTRTEDLGDHKEEGDLEKIATLEAFDRQIAIVNQRLEVDQKAEDLETKQPATTGHKPWPAPVPSTDDAHQTDGSLPGHDDLADDVHIPIGEQVSTIVNEIEMLTARAPQSAWEQQAINILEKCKDLIIRGIKP